MTSKTKGETLLYLQREKFNVPKLILFNNFNYKKSKKKFIEKIKSKFKKKKIIVRSSSSSEDSTKFSNAGKFLSIGNIYAFQTKLVSDSIDKVISSYKSKKNNQIIVQEMVKNVKISGVCSTVDLHNYQPVTVINYYTGKDTEVVTSGKKNTFSLSITDKEYLSKSHKFYKLLNEIEKLKKNI